MSYILAKRLSQTAGRCRLDLTIKTMWIVLNPVMLTWSKSQNLLFHIFCLVLFVLICIILASLDSLGCFVLGTLQNLFY